MMFTPQKSPGGEAKLYNYEYKSNLAQSRSTRSPGG